LSGGEAKRVALARTLATEPSVVLLDEPLTGLDRELHDRLATQLAQLLVEHSITAVLVTHDPAEADVVASRSVHMDQIDG
jgi:thiamine transport system ATP-binding protein